MLGWLLHRKEPGSVEPVLAKKGDFLFLSSSLLSSFTLPFLAPLWRLLPLLLLLLVGLERLACIRDDRGADKAPQAMARSLQIALIRLRPFSRQDGNPDPATNQFRGNVVREPEIFWLLPHCCRCRDGAR